jgi:hypothetical protein
LRIVGDLLRRGNHGRRNRRGGPGWRLLLTVECDDTQ